MTQNISWGWPTLKWNSTVCDYWIQKHVIIYSLLDGTWPLSSLMLKKVIHFSSWKKELDKMQNVFAAWTNDPDVKGHIPIVTLYGVIMFKGPISSYSECVLVRYFYSLQMCNLLMDDCIVSILWIRIKAFFLFILTHILFKFINR